MSLTPGTGWPPAVFNASIVAAVGLTGRRIAAAFCGSMPGPPKTTIPAGLSVARPPGPMKGNCCSIPCGEAAGGRGRPVWAASFATASAERTAATATGVGLAGAGAAGGCCAKAWRVKPQSKQSHWGKQTAPASCEELHRLSFPSLDAETELGGMGHLVARAFERRRTRANQFAHATPNI